jgi:hypothetical protein
MVPNGTAPDESDPIKKKFNPVKPPMIVLQQKKMRFNALQVKLILSYPGKRVADNSIFIFHASPPFIL